MDELENPYADQAVAGEAEAPQDPVQAAKDEAWLAQFRADNAAAGLARHNFEAANEDEAEATAAGGRAGLRPQRRAARRQGRAAGARDEAAERERKAQADAARHDEYEWPRRQTELHLAEPADESAATSGPRPPRTRRRSALRTAVADDAAHLQEAPDEYEIMQEQAIAAQRIATDEAKLPHPGDPAPADPADHQP